MAIAMTFPGQGSQIAGMGKEWADNFVAARDVFDDVDEALGEKLSSIIFNGPDDKLTLTMNAQPALMAVSMAIIRVMEAEGFDLKKTVSYVAGHSLGEYSALCAAGMFSIADTARLLRIRGNAMQAAVPENKGAMAAIIGLEQADIKAMCSEVVHIGVCQIANDNGGGQWVISGDREAVEKVAELALERGAKRAIMLPVSAPFHSSLMTPAAQAMAIALDEVKKQNPCVPVIANTKVMPISDSDQIISLLVEQITDQVRWRETITWFGDNDVETLYEVGSGKVLTGLARRINRSLSGITVNNPADLAKALEMLNA